MARKVKFFITSITVITISIIFLSIIFILSLQISKNHYAEIQRSNHGISKRKLPYPFKSALTICSDIDSTNSLEEFLTIQEFLNTKNTTEMGVGLGLEIGNSIFPIQNEAHPFGLIADEKIQYSVLSDLIKLGYIDFIHSFQEAKREEIKKISEILVDRGCHFDVWINHANAPTNLGYQDYSLGDNINSIHYHTDFSIRRLGIKFVSIGEVTGIICQGVPLNLNTFFVTLNRRHLFPSLYNNVLKETAKYSLSFLGIIEKYSNRKNNDLTYPLRLDDGQYIFGFVRSNISYRGTGGKAAHSFALSDILREEIFNELNKIGGYMLVYTHLGINNGYPFIPKSTQKSLRLLEKEYRMGNIYVTTTAKLLKFYVNNKYLIWHSELEGNKTNIYITNISDPVRGNFVPKIEDLNGITFYTDNPYNTYIYIQNKKINKIMRNNVDDTNRKSVMIPITSLPRLDELMQEYRKKGYFGFDKTKSTN